MRRTLALAVLGLALGGPAAADPTCTYAGHDGTRLALCTEYVCVEICAPQYHVDPQCSTDLPVASVRAACVLVDAVYVVI
jgi:hypothetical protein